jgi:hypothetical protein
MHLISIKWFRRMPKFAEQEIVLPPNTTAGFAVPPRGVRITCLSGTLWVTGVGDPQDYLLSAGQKFVPRSGGRLVVESMAASPARFLLQRSPSRRGGQWLTSPPAEAAASLDVVAWRKSQ